jgi:membrane associated rhomboid family serine protease
MFVPLYDHNPNDPLFYPYVTRGLVAVNVLVFVFFHFPFLTPDPTWAILTYGVVPASVTFDTPFGIAPIPEELTFFTYMFLHAGWLHLIGNMLFLWVFGDNVEHALGRIRFFIFYIVCGVAGAIAHYISVPDSPEPLIGASAAVAGVVAAYLMLFPHAKVWVLLFLRIPVRLSAKWILGAWIAFQFVNLFINTDPNTAWWAHIGGLATGAILVIFMRRPNVPLFAKDVRVISDVR